MNLAENAKIIGSIGNKRNKTKLFGAYSYQFYVVNVQNL
jgi:hypothetical protein